MQEIDARLFFGSLPVDICVVDGCAEYLNTADTQSRPTSGIVREGLVEFYVDINGHASSCFGSDQDPGPWPSGHHPSPVTKTDESGYLGSQE